MLPKEHRLNNDWEFKKTMRKGQRINGRLMDWFFQSKPGGVKIGVIVSNRVSRRATKRNQIKRRLRGLFQGGLSRLQEKERKCFKG